MIEQGNKLSLSRQCSLLGVPRSSYYYRGNPQLVERDEELMQAIDRIYTEEPAYGNRRMLDELLKLGHKVGRDKVRSLMSAMGLEAIYPKPRTTKPGKGHKKYPYLLRNLEIETPDQGSQYTGNAFTGTLQSHGVKISMDGRGRALDNVMVERFWRTLKYDDIYIRCYETMPELYHGIDALITKYNRRKHQTLGMSPEEKYFGQSQEQAA